MIQQPSDPDVETEVDKWRERWGGEVAEQLKGYVEQIMPDFEYLNQFKV